MNDGPDEAVDAVRRYCAALKGIRARLFEAYPQLGGVRDLVAAVRGTRTLPREGGASTGIEYSVHGAGCRMSDDQGRVVDVDLVDDVEAFDAWRIRFLLDDDAEACPSVEELHAACSYLAGLDELGEVTAGRWYALPDH